MTGISCSQKMPRWSAEGCRAQRPGRIRRLASVLTRAATGTQRMGAATRTRKRPFGALPPRMREGQEKEAPPAAPYGRKRPTGEAEQWSDDRDRMSDQRRSGHLDLRHLTSVI